MQDDYRPKEKFDPSSLYSDENRADMNLVKSGLKLVSPADKKKFAQGLASISAPGQGGSVANQTQGNSNTNEAAKEETFNNAL